MDKSTEAVRCDELSMLMSCQKQGQSFEEAFETCSAEGGSGFSDFGHRLISQLKAEALS